MTGQWFATCPHGLRTARDTASSMWKTSTPACAPISSTLSPDSTVRPARYESSTPSTISKKNTEKVSGSLNIVLCHLHSTREGKSYGSSILTFSRSCLQVTPFYSFPHIIKSIFMKLGILLCHANLKTDI